MALSLAACGSPPGKPPRPEELGAARLTLGAAPADALCLRVTAAGSRAVTRAFDLTPGRAAALLMDRLPTGGVSFAAEAFAVGCAALTGGDVPRWVSDPAVVTIAPAEIAEVALLLRRNGRAQVGVDFDSSPGRFRLAPHRARVEALLAQMTLEEKAGQMLQVELKSVGNLDNIQTSLLGSVLVGPGSVPATSGPSAWADLSEAVMAIAAQTRLGIPLAFATDGIHGHNNVNGAVIFPHNVGLGCAGDPALVEEVTRVTALEMAGTGLRWTFAPVLAAARDERWGRTYEAFGETAELPARLGAAAVRGLQGPALSDPTSVLACAKHFAGDGATTWGTGLSGRIDQGNVVGDEAALRALHVDQYRDAIESGVGSVMVSYSSWQGLKMHAHRQLLTEVLKGELGFEGIVLSDHEGIHHLPGTVKDQVVASVNAGMDMLMVAGKWREVLDGLKTAAASGEIPASRLDDAVRRILSVKVAMGLWGGKAAVDRALTRKVGSAEHRAVARRAVRRSLVLLKNEGGALPLPRTGRIHVGGKSADNIGRQCGGWTLSWAGSRNLAIPGTTILQGLRNGAPDAQITLAADGTGGAGAEVGVVVIGEEPYAEFMGDKADLSLAPADVEAVRAMKAANLKVVVVLVTGRPLVLEPILPLADAIVAAWLPGTEGDGVADVLYGFHPPTAKLSMSWPASMAQIPINVGDPTYEPLFPYGHGLTFPKPAGLASDAGAP
jgi:beta-glucosidase